MSRPIERSRPLWEMYLVEGLEADRFAILTKTHQALVDGITTVDLGQLVLSRGGRTGAQPTRPEPGGDWIPAPAPSSVTLVRDALVEVAQQPTQLAGAV